MCAEVLFSGDFNFHNDDSSDNDANTLAFHNMLVF